MNRIFLYITGLITALILGWFLIRVSLYTLALLTIAVLLCLSIIALAPLIAEHFRRGENKDDNKEDQWPGF